MCQKVTGIHQWCPVTIKYFINGWFLKKDCLKSPQLDRPESQHRLPGNWWPISCPQMAADVSHSDLFCTILVFFSFKYSYIYQGTIIMRTYIYINLYLWWVTLVYKTTLRYRHTFGELQWELLVQLSNFNQQWLPHHQPWLLINIKKKNQSKPNWKPRLFLLLKI